MALHPDFPRSPYAPLVPSQRWFPADETLRTTAYDKLLPPLVAKIREQVHAWRQKGYAGASATSVRRHLPHVLVELIAGSVRVLLRGPHEAPANFSPERLILIDPPVPHRPTSGADYRLNEPAPWSKAG